nr:hypothetical protein [Tanacetum cinerariifolium]
ADDGKGSAATKIGPSAPSVCSKDFVSITDVNRCDDPDVTSSPSNTVDQVQTDGRCVGLKSVSHEDNTRLRNEAALSENTDTQPTGSSLETQRGRT